jgi:hypothetical protein
MSARVSRACRKNANSSLPIIIRATKPPIVATTRTAAIPVAITIS